MITQDYPFIDIHTHATTGEIRLATFGVHPWQVQNADLTRLETLLQQNRLAAIGETGLDRAHPDTYALQKEVFEQHILLAEQYQKPLIIHNVHATADILQLHKKHQPRQPWILHGFNGTADEIRQLTSKGLFLSVGESIFYPNRKITQAISSLPLDNLFLETDTSPKTIEEIYKKALELLNLPLIRLKEQIFSNFARLNLNAWTTGNNVLDCSSATVALINCDEAMCS
ncbi:MAG: TatD family hydrolase [Bacteroidales bacterium]|nr:TatD family hydrolase [Bacteroidales bacterium]